MKSREDFYENERENTGYRVVNIELREFNAEYQALLGSPVKIENLEKLQRENLKFRELGYIKVADVGKSETRKEGFAKFGAPELCDSWTLKLWNSRLWNSGTREFRDTRSMKLENFGICEIWISRIRWSAKSETRDIRTSRILKFANSKIPELWNSGITEFPYNKIRGLVNSRIPDFAKLVNRGTSK